jgi:hypothetical protein
MKNNVSKAYSNEHICKYVRLSLSAESASHSTVFFSHNKSVNNTFCHGLSTKQTTIVDVDRRSGLRRSVVKTIVGVDPHVAMQSNTTTLKTYPVWGTSAHYGPDDASLVLLRVRRDSNDFKLCTIR